MATESRLITIRCGLDFAYEAHNPTHIVLMIQPRIDEAQRVEREIFQIVPEMAVEQYQDLHGNIVRRFELPIGRTTILHDAMVTVSSLPESPGIAGFALEPKQMSPAESGNRWFRPGAEADVARDFALHFTEPLLRLRPAHGFRLREIWASAARSGPGGSDL